MFVAFNEQCKGQHVTIDSLVTYAFECHTEVMRQEVFIIEVAVRVDI